MNKTDLITPLPATPPPGLLESMTVRYDHALGCPGYYDDPLYAQSGFTHARRLESALTTMKQLYEEVSGHGFYKWREEDTPVRGLKNELVALKAETNALLKEAAELHRVKGLDTPFYNCSVNWGDLTCWEASFKVSEEGIGMLTVEISEASPSNNYFFQQWISERLAERGFGDVYVITSW